MKRTAKALAVFGVMILAFILYAAIFGKTPREQTQRLKNRLPEVIQFVSENKDSLNLLIDVKNRTALEYDFSTVGDIYVQGMSMNAYYPLSGVKELNLITDAEKQAAQDIISKLNSKDVWAMTISPDAIDIYFASFGHAELTLQHPTEGLSEIIEAESEYTEKNRYYYNYSAPIDENWRADIIYRKQG
ncbi:MAG: hypothetical protein LBT12_06855 [Oscillospiraceae bacterium]|jgi:hypothetical protein|nr:hypothetical protein [Oscillospiraceae bacterium]